MYRDTLLPLKEVTYHSEAVWSGRYRRLAFQISGAREKESLVLLRCEGYWRIIQGPFAYLEDVKLKKKKKKKKTPRQPSVRCNRDSICMSMWRDAVLPL
jgi:hypothetical protein